MSHQYGYNGALVVYIDGCCLQNHVYGPRKAGYGVWFNHNHSWNDWGAVTDVEATNNNAEIEAAIQAINICGSKGRRKIELKTDSNFLIQCVTEFMPKWKANGWRKTDGSPVKNVVKFKELNKAMNDWDMTTYWTHVPAHQGNVGNENADQLAQRGANSN